MSNDPKASRLVELRERLKDLDAQILALSERDTLSEDEEARWDDLCAERDVIVPEFEKLEIRAARVADIKSKTFRQISGLPDARSRVEELHGVDVRKMDWRAARDGALAILDDREQNYTLNTHQGDMLHSRVRAAKDTDLARRIIVTENEHYRSAWHKMMTRGTTTVLDQDEQRAMLRYEEYRAASEGTTTAGGFAIPVKVAA
ncbi:MAG TPA: hypothetical protein VGJ95_05855 [Pseudonocardiaceae bacterium]